MVDTMTKYKILFLLSILLFCMSDTSSASEKLGSLKLVLTIDPVYKQVNKENWQTLLNGKLEQEPNLSSTFTLFKNGTLPTVFYTKDLNDPLSSNILINQMEGYSKIEENLIPKIKASMNNINSFKWNDIAIVRTKNNIRGFKLFDFTDELNPTHKNITYFLEDAILRRWVSFSFNNIDTNEVSLIINSVSFDLKPQQPLSLYNHKNFSIKYPTTWDTTKQDNSVTFMAVESQKNGNDLFRENLAVYIELVDPKLTLESVVESAITAFKQEGGSVKDILDREVKKNSKQISYGLFKTKQVAKNHIVISTTVVFKKGNKLIMINFFHDNAEDSHYTSIYNSIIDSFELK